MVVDNDQTDNNNVRSLPPLIRDIQEGKVSWQGISGVDFELLGYFLSCHLVIEHYMDEYLKTDYSQLDWEAAKPTFAQRVALLRDMGLSERFNCIPAIKHLNTVRNKLSHRIDFKIDDVSLLPLKHYLQKVCEGDQALPSDPKLLLEKFTLICCATFAGAISRTARDSRHTRP